MFIVPFEISQLRAQFCLYIFEMSDKIIKTNPSSDLLNTFNVYSIGEL